MQKTMFVPPWGACLAPSPWKSRFPKIKLDPWRLSSFHVLISLGAQIFPICAWPSRTATGIATLEHAANNICLASLNETPVDSSTSAIAPSLLLIKTPTAFEISGKDKERSKNSRTSIAAVLAAQGYNGYDLKRNFFSLIQLRDERHKHQSWRDRAPPDRRSQG